MSDQSVMTSVPEFKIARPPKWDDPADKIRPELPKSLERKARRRRSAQRRDRLEYMPALDGLRALAVIAVLAYHADQTWARAGFLGVDVFFVISGYLITALLLSEWRREGSISLLNFWRRRALRLLPSLLVMLAAVALVTPILAPDQLAQLRGDLVAALTYVSNWRMIFQEMPYFQAMGRPPLLQHLWSLAVEEQFYLLWPMVLIFALKRKSTKPRSTVPWIILAIGLSALAMGLMYSPESDSSRIYYGTDTRVGTILIGAALAFVWMPGARTARPKLMGSLIRDFAGLAAIAGLAWIIYSWTEFDPFLYRGGFVLVAALAAIVVAVSAHPGWLARRLLGSLPLRWLGKRSYAIYLWHWPVFMLSRPDVDIDLRGYPLLALRLTMTIALAIATHRLIERPISQDTLGRAWRGLKGGLSNRSVRPVLSGVGIMLLPALIASAIFSGILRNQSVSSDSALLAFDAAAESAVDQSGAVADQFGEMAVTELPPVPPPEVVPGAIPAPAPPPPPPTVTAVGDSVMLIARDELIGKLGAATVPALVDAAIGRQTKSVIETTRALKDAGQLGNNVIVHTGTNGPISGKQLDQLMELLKDVPRVFLVNVHVARPWESFNNQLLAENVGRWPNTELLDWNGLANAHPEAFYKDGVHLKPTGMRLYVELLSGSVLS
ncbi:MAG: acyltransferase family protein [Actinomycetota bacterium]